MTADAGVEALDVVEHICSGLVPGAIGFALGAFGLQRQQEALHRRIFLDVAGPARAADDAITGHTDIHHPQLVELTQIRSRRSSRPR